MFCRIFNIFFQNLKFCYTFYATSAVESVHNKRVFTITVDPVYSERVGAAKNVH